jgi:hypothetical protein
VCKREGDRETGPECEREIERVRERNQSQYDAFDEETMQKDPAVSTPPPREKKRDKIISPAMYRVHQAAYLRASPARPCLHPCR